jgi:ABC-type Fe3+ transport system permease subunit
LLMPSICLITLTAMLFAFIFTLLGSRDFDFNRLNYNVGEVIYVTVFSLWFVVYSIYISLPVGIFLVWTLRRIDTYLVICAEYLRFHKRRYLDFLFS